MLIESIEKGSLGSRVGIEKGDVLLAVGNPWANGASLFDLRILLSKPGSVKCLIRRGTTRREITLDLAAPTVKVEPAGALKAN